MVTVETRKLEKRETVGVYEGGYGGNNRKSRRGSKMGMRLCGNRCYREVINGRSTVDIRRENSSRRKIRNSNRRTRTGSNRKCNRTNFIARPTTIVEECKRRSRTKGGSNRGRKWDNGIEAGGGGNRKGSRV